VVNEEVLEGEDDGQRFVTELFVAKEFIPEALGIKLFFVTKACIIKLFTTVINEAG
jgi:hypothetical protein